MHTRRRKAARSQSQRSVWKSALLSLPITAATALLLLVLSALLLLLTKDPVRYHGVVGVLLLYATALLGGVASALLSGRRSPLLAGLLAGVSLFVLFTIPALFLQGSVQKLYGIALRSPVIAASLGGAYLACRKKRARRH